MLRVIIREGREKHSKDSCIVGEMSGEGEGIYSAGANISGIWCGDSGTIGDKDKIGGTERDKDDDESCGEISVDVLTAGEIRVDKFEVGGRDKNLLVNFVWEKVEG